MFLEFLIHNYNTVTKIGKFNIDKVALSNPGLHSNFVSCPNNAFIVIFYPLDQDLIQDHALY